MGATVTALGGGRHRIVVDCTTVGLEIPPTAIQGSLRKTPSGWLLEAPHADRARLTPWLRLVGALEVAAPNGGVRARFATLPDTLDIVARVAPLEAMSAGPDGVLSIELRAPSSVAEGCRVMLDTRPDDRDAALTDRQHELLRHCVAAGYYSVPRAATLRQLAEQLGLSATSLSLALRRAEAKIVAAYMGRKRAVPPAQVLATARLSTPPKAS